MTGGTALLNEPSVSYSTTSTDYLCGQNFKSICDFDYTPDTRHDLPRSGVIYCKTDYLPSLFIDCAPHGPYTLVTGQSDYAIIGTVADRKPTSIRRWFAVNAAIKRPWLEPIPLGIADPCWPHGDWATIQSALGTPRDRYIHLAFALSTNPDEREAALDRFKWMPGATIQCYLSPKERPDFERYIQEMARHWFAVSPPGNGIDCHRTWEALYLGVAPIVKRSVVTEAFEDMGLVLVDNWHGSIDLVPPQLESVGNREKLWMPYWKKRIRDERI